MKQRYFESNFKRDVHSVSQLNNRVKSYIEEKYFNIWVEGELSVFKTYTSGHSYFTIKDDQSEISCVLFQSNSTQLTFKPVLGMKVLLSGTVSLYISRGQYQFVVKQMYPSGKGKLWHQFEKLRKKLSDEGLFSEQIKKSLPEHPKRIGVVTSSSGAVIQDIIRIINRRAPHVTILLRPCRVQGIGAEEDIADGIRELNEYGTVDILIIGRGGGSMEDLWCFNEEVVARAIFESNIPIISAIGHETDFTIADFVSDFRASTPSVASELAVQDNRELLQNLDEKSLKIKNQISLAIKNRQDVIKNVFLRYGFHRPKNIINEYSQILINIQKNLKIFKSQKIDNLHIRIKNLNNRLTDMNPENVLERGYGLISDTGDTIVNDTTQINKGDNILITLYKNIISAEVKDISKR